MFIYIIKWTIIYSVLIFLLHQIYLFLEKNLTITETHNYVSNSNNEIKNINRILDSNITSTNIKDIKPNNNRENNNMENELNDFLSKLNTKNLNF